VTLKPLPLATICVTVMLAFPGFPEFVIVSDMAFVPPTFTVPKSSFE
jgi:hypothetical protein